MRQRRQPGRPRITAWLGRWAATGIVLGCAVTACSSAPPPVPSPTSNQAGQFRSSDAPALLVQCMISQGTLGLSDSIFSGSPSWLRNGNIVITAGTAAKFSAWYRGNSGISVAGKTPRRVDPVGGSQRQAAAGGLRFLGVGAGLAAAGVREGSGRG